MSIPVQPEAMAAHVKAEAVAVAKKAATEREAEKLRTYERERKQRWRAARREKGLPTEIAARQRTPRTPPGSRRGVEGRGRAE